MNLSYCHPFGLIARLVHVVRKMDGQMHLQTGLPLTVPLQLVFLKALFPCDVAILRFSTIQTFQKSIKIITVHH